MFGVSRGRIISAIITTVVLTALVASYIVFVLQPGGPHTAHTGATALASATAMATSGVTTQFTPTPGITVVVHASPTKGTSSSSTSSYTGGAGGTTSTVPPRYPTPIPTSGGGSGSGASPTPTATTPSATPTATTPALVDAAQLISYTPTGPITTLNPSFVVNATYLNSGTSTWTPDYKLLCRQFCGVAWGGGGTFYPSLAPGQSFTFSRGEAITSTSSYSVNYAVWQLWSSVSGFFGPQIVIKIINPGWYLDFHEASPSCMGDGSVWTQQGSSGTVSCGGNGLAMADGGSNGASLDLHSTPASYDPGHYSMKVHVHFDTSAPSVFAGVIVTEPTATSSFREVIMVSPAGYMCYETNTAYCLTTAVQPITASQDYDLTVTVYNNGAAFSAGYSPGGGIHGGISAGGLTGLIEVASPGVTDAAYFTNYTFYQYKSA